MKQVLFHGLSKDITGKRFGRLVAINRAGHIFGNSWKRTAWMFKCDCGKIAKLSTNAVVRGNTKSCGCLKSEKFPGINIRHGYSFRNKRHPVYCRWRAMLWRCSPKNKKAKRSYFDRGIKVCKRWLKFENFRDDMESSFMKGLTIHRIDNDKDYCKSNCKWTDSIEQSRHRTDNRIITINGETKILCDWAKHFGISLPTFYQRINKKGMNEIEALTTPLRGT